MAEQKSTAEKTEAVKVNACEVSHDRGRVLPYLFFWGMDSLTEDTVITP